MPDPETSRRPPPRALVFGLGGWILAATTGPGGRVVEIDACTLVPTGPSCLIGLGNAGGTVLSIVDLRPLLGLRAKPWSWPLRALAVGGDALRAAVAIEEVLGFEAFLPDALEPLAEDVPGGLSAFAHGALELPLGRAVLIDLPRLVEAVRLKRPPRGERFVPGSTR